MQVYRMGNREFIRSTLTISFHIVYQNKQHATISNLICCNRGFTQAIAFLIYEISKQFGENGNYKSHNTIIVQ